MDRALLHSHPERTVTSTIDRLVSHGFSTARGFAVQIARYNAPLLTLSLSPEPLDPNSLDDNG